MGENPAALRAAVFSLASKNLRGGGRSNAPPPAGRGLIEINIFYRMLYRMRMLFCCLIEIDIDIECDIYG